MSNQMGPPGISYAELNSAISAVRSELRHEINDLRHDISNVQRWVEQEIQRMEEEMRQVGEMIVNAIHQQTLAVVGGVAASTAMVEQTKRQIEEDFQATRGRIEVQTESTLQIEVGKKVADASAIKGKLESFFQDIRQRYDRALVGVGLNQELYSQNFQKITDDYQQKLRVIGDHIFRIKLEDIAPAVDAARVPYEDAHSLPIEMDLLRLSARSANLDETLELLKTSRLDEVTQSLDALDESLMDYTRTGLVPCMGDDALCVQGLAISDDKDFSLLCGHKAHEPQGQQAVSLEMPDQSLAAFHGQTAQQRVARQVAKSPHRPATHEDMARLTEAAQKLARQDLISADALALFQDFLRAGKLSLKGA